MEAVFSADEVKRLERAHPEGLSAGAVIELLRQRGITLAEATFRKYVQLGLLPRSRRVGRKGKHRGSHGLYPVAVVGRLAQIRQLMETGLTLEEIQSSAVAFENELDAVRGAADAMLARLDGQVVARGRQPAAVKRVQLLRAQADELTKAFEEATRELCPPSPAAHEEEDPVEVARVAERELRGRRPARAAAAGHVTKQRRTTR